MLLLFFWPVSVPALPKIHTAFAITYAVNIFILGKLCTCQSCLVPTGRALAKAFLTDNMELASIVTERHRLQSVALELLLHLLYVLSSLELSAGLSGKEDCVFLLPMTQKPSSCLAVVFPSYSLLSYKIFSNGRFLKYINKLNHAQKLPSSTILGIATSNKLWVDDLAENNSWFGCFRRRNRYSRSLLNQKSCKQDLVERTNALNIKDTSINHFNVLITVTGKVSVIIFPV